MATKFGALINGVGGITAQLAVLDALNVEYTRDAIVLQTWSGNNNHYRKLIEAGYKVALNLNWGGPVDGPVPFPTTLTTYLAKIASVLDTFSGGYAPEFVVLENEETNRTYHSGTMEDYLAMLEAAIPVVHSYGLKVTNGGIHSQGVCYWVWRDLVDNGAPGEAEAWMALTFNAAMENAALNPGSNAELDEYWAKIDTLLTGYTTLDIDWVNLHLYEPLNGIGDGLVTVPTAFERMRDYVFNRTGKQVITNESGQENEDAGLCTSMMQAFVDGSYEYCIWFSGDGDGGARALNEQTSPYELRLNGVAFRDFTAENPAPEEEPVVLPPPDLRGPYKKKSDYFKAFTEEHFLTAHLTGTPPRNSFFRINDEAEFDAAATNYSHFPCVVHVDASVRYKRDKPSLPRRITTNTLVFLSKLQREDNPYQADAIEAAYDEAFTLMEDFIAWMVNDMDTNGTCGELFILDLSKTNAEQVGPYEGNLYGWRFSFVDEKPAAKYYGYRFGEPGELPGDGETPGNSSNIIPFTAAESTKQITISSNAFPEVQVWENGPPVRLIAANVTTDSAPPNHTIITVTLPGVAGFIVLKW